MHEAITDARHRGDCRMMIVDSQGEFIIQRDAPRLALTEPVMNNDDSMTLRAPNKPSASFALSNASRRIRAHVMRPLRCSNH
ncbi:MAG: MOSC N-terminal beta barrel domain-containing protein [Thermoflexales bacterium]